ncbi:TetR/AcrR family transcriptional regulator C-terminal domain-containing protein [Blastococcus sp. SYSU D00695]
MAIESSGGGDPARTMALLWRTPGEPGRRPGPRAGLDVDRVVVAAVALADREGLGAVTMRRLATELGVGAMTLYTHVPGKAELVDLMYDAVLGELYEQPPAGPWRARLSAVARENWALFVRHPWAAGVGTGRPILGPNLMRKYDLELAAADGLGLSEVEMDLVITLVGAFVRGSVVSVHDQAAAERSSGLTDEQWWRATEPHIEKVFDAERFPTAARVGPVAGPELGAGDPARSFEFGLARLLDGIAAMVEG